MGTRVGGGVLRGWRAGACVTGEMFGPYRLVSLLGRGGMGEVWRAVDTRKDREVALKVLGSWLGGDAEFAHRLRRESALAAKLTGPHIVPIHDYGDVGGQLFLDMPLIDGTDLGVLLARGGPLPPARAVRIVAQVAKALTVAHRAGLVHRDVKPSNILVDNDGGDHTYLIDFGIARALDGTKVTLSGSAVGTPAYMAPEQFDGQGDHRGDVYALGCVLHEALTGTPPFRAESLLGYMRAHDSAPPPRPSQVRPGVPGGFDGVVATALAKDPAGRYPTVGDLSAAAQRAAQGRKPEPMPRNVLVGGPGAARPLGSRPSASPVAGPRADRSLLPLPSAGLVVPMQRPGAIPPPGRVSWPGVPQAAPRPRRRRRPLLLAGLSVVLTVGLVLTAVTVLIRPRSTPITERPLTGHTYTVFAVAIGQLDGRPVVVSGGGDGTVRTWDLIARTRS